MGTPTYRQFVLAARHGRVTHVGHAGPDVDLMDMLVQALVGALRGPWLWFGEHHPRRSAGG